MSERSTSQIEREVETKRAEVEETINVLRSKFSSGQLVEMLTRSLTGAGGQGNEFVTNLGRQVKENPVPLALTGIGLAWLLVSQTARGKPQAAEPRAISPPETAGQRDGEPGYDRGRYTADEAEHGPEHALKALLAGTYDVAAALTFVPGAAYDHARYEADADAHGLEHAARELKAGTYALDRTAAGAARLDRDRIAADEVKYGAAHVSEKLKAGAYEMASTSTLTSVRETASDAATSVRIASQRAQRGLVDFIAEEPLIAGALGVALGAAIGAALPTTRRNGEAPAQGRDAGADPDGG